jgi:hypothetical protein
MLTGLTGCKRNLQLNLEHTGGLEYWSDGVMKKTIMEIFYYARGGGYAAGIWIQGINGGCS